MSNKADLFEDEIEEEEVEEVEETSDTPILDITEQQIKHAKERTKDHVGIFPEDELAERKKTRSKSKREKKERTPRVLGTVTQDLLDEVGDALGVFDAEVANKKCIRNLRRALQKLSLARYPKKKKEGKTKIVIKKKK
jgi:guanylate kinase